MSIKSSLVLLVIVAALIAQQQPVIDPELSFTSISGQTLKLSELQGNPVLISFWATDCPSCLEEIPQLISLHQEYAKRGLTLIAVAMYYDPPNRVLALANDRQLPYPVALDPEQTLTHAFGNVQATPTTFLLDREGRITWKQLGRFDLAGLRQRVENML